MTTKYYTQTLQISPSTYSTRSTLPSPQTTVHLGCIYSVGTPLGFVRVCRRLGICDFGDYGLSTEIWLEIVYYSPSDVTNKETVPVKLQSHTQYTGTTCWFNLLPDSESGDDDVGVESPEFSYVKEAAGNVSPFLSLVSPVCILKVVYTTSASGGWILICMRVFLRPLLQRLLWTSH